MRIEDLKKQNVSASISMGQPSHGNDQQQNQEENTVYLGVNEPLKKKKKRETVSNPVQNAAATISTIPINQVKDLPTGRVSANFDSLPSDPRDTLGVDIKESPESEIFKEGGEFDTYIKEKVEEVKDWYEEEVKKAKAKAEAEELAREKEKLEDPDNKENDDFEDEYFETNIAPATNGRVIDVTSRKGKNNDMKITTLEPEKSRKEAYIEPEEMEEEEEYTTEESDNIDYDDLDDEPEDDEILDGSEETDEKDISMSEAADIHNAEEIISSEPIPEEKPIEEKKSSISDKINRVTRRIMEVDIEEEDLDDLEVETSINNEDDSVEILKSLISEKLVPVSKKLDISSFTVVKKATSSNNIFETKEAAIAKWVLPATGICILLREISGSNLEMMRSFLSRRVPDMRGALNIIYDHIVSPKPSNFEAWMKSIAFADYDHLFMAIYIAAFSDSNFMPIDCAECKKPYLTEDIDIMNMVKFNDDESEQKFTKLYNTEPVNPNGLYVTENVAISDKFAIAFREPSLYSVLIESQYFDDKFSRKYQQAIAIMPYIDQIFIIDMENRRLIPVDFKLIANKPSDTARLKIKKIDAMLNTLNVDQNAILSTYTTKINERTDWFTYQIPASTCPNCKHENPAQEDQSASSLVFLRNRLGALVTI